MRRMTGREHGLVLVPLLVICSLCFAPTLATAHSPDKNTSTPTQLLKDAEVFRRFEDAFARLSVQGTVAFVVEGTPHRPELTDEQIVNLEKFLAALPRDDQGRPSDFDALVDAVANAYDYKASRLIQGRRKSRNVFTLTKRYSDPEDLPFITLEEAALSLRNIILATERLTSREVVEGSNGKALLRLYTSLTPEQRQIANRETANQDGTGAGLPIAQLSKEQRAEAWQFFAGFHFVSLRAVRSIERRLRGCRNPEAVFCRFDYDGLNVFGYGGPFGRPEGAIQKITLSHMIFTDAGGASGMMVPRDQVEYRDGKFVRYPPDPGIPDPRVPIRPLTLPLSCASTLGKLAERLSLSGGRPSIIAAVHPSLAAKPISLFGIERAAVRELLEAAATIYGLRVEPFIQKEPQGDRQGYRIALPAPKVLERFEDLPNEIRRLLPAPLLQIPVGGLQDAMQAATRPDALQLPNPIGARVQFENQRKQMGRREAFRRLYTAALARLRALVEPKIPQKSDLRIPVMESGEEAKCLVALTSLATLGDFLDQLTEQEVPFRIRDFQNSVLSLHYEETPETFVLGYGLYHRDKNDPTGGSATIPKVSVKGP